MLGTATLYQVRNPSEGLAIWELISLRVAVVARVIVGWCFRKGFLERLVFQQGHLPSTL